MRIQGNYEEARRVYEQLLQERGSRPPFMSPAETQREAQIDALLLSEVGWTWYYAADYGHTRQYCERGEQVLRDAGVVGGPAWARLYFQQSYILWQEGKYDEALHAANKALQGFAEMLPEQRPHHVTVAPLTRTRRTLEGDPVDVARTHRLLGALANSVGQLTESLTHMNTALAILEEHNHKREVAHVSCNVGYIHLQKAEHAEAQLFLRRSLSMAEQIGDIPLTAVNFSNLCVLGEHPGDLSEAGKWVQRRLAPAGAS